MADQQRSQAQSLLGLAILILIVLSWPGSCEWNARSERIETEAICRRAIERRYGATAQEAEGIVKAQREWEGR